MINLDTFKTYSCAVALSAVAISAIAFAGPVKAAPVQLFPFFQPLPPNGRAAALPALSGDAYQAAPSEDQMRSRCGALPPPNRLLCDA
jgi:hypothetical protein